MKLVLDGEKIRSRDDLHKQMAAVLDFPEWYGGNLDALYDCLTDLMEEVNIHILHMSALKTTLGEYAERLLSVLKDAETLNLNIQVIID